ncbi:MAG: hypothetical protein QN163_09635 [Armatimonadota bacterium]|nr:hypothetical protein [Armatimonadota bacterium]MDR5697977.1 hypothetical protein [Armatimonadota bacterium]
MTSDDRGRHETALSASDAWDLLRAALIAYGVRPTEEDLAAAADQLRAVLRRLAALEAVSEGDR